MRLLFGLMVTFPPRINSSFLIVFAAIFTQNCREKAVSPGNNFADSGLSVEAFKSLLKNKKVCDEQLSSKNELMRIFVGSGV